jgi:GAF domain-containing protein
MNFEYPGSESERLLELVVRLSAKLHDPMLWEDIICSGTSLLGSEKGALLLSDEGGTLSLTATVGLSDAHRHVLASLTPRSVDFLRRSRGRPIVVHDVAGHPAPFGVAASLLAGDCRSAVYLPLTSSNGDLLAVLAAFYGEGHQHSEREARLLSQLALILGPLVANARAQKSAREVAAAEGRRARRLHYLSEACAALSLAGGGAAALQRAASLATSWMADRCVIEIADEGNELAATYTVCRLRGEWCDGQYSPRPNAHRKIWLDKLLRTGEPILLAGLSRDHPAVPVAGCCDSQWKAEGGLSLLAVALRRQGRVIGAMTLLRQQVGHTEYDRDDVACAIEIVRHTELALDYETSRGLRAASRVPLARAQG